jgi:hypothetical protein
MPRSRQILLLEGCLLAVVFLLAFPRTGYAYIDPGTGSMMLQLLAAGLVSAALIFRRSLGRFLGLFRKAKK